MFKDHVKIMSSAAKEAGSERISHIFNDILSYHADVADIKENIKDRNTKLLVLSHFVPPVNQITERKVKSIFKDSKQKLSLIQKESQILINSQVNVIKYSSFNHNHINNINSKLNSIFDIM